MPKNGSAQRSGALCLSFDDWFVDEWWSARGLLRSFGAKATFYVSRLHTLSPSQLDKIADLAADGHEIGCHTVNHYRLPEYLLEQSKEHYLREEVDAEIQELSRLNIHPTSFAYPYHEYVTALHDLLLQRFRILRFRWDGPLLQERIYQPGSNTMVNIIGSLDITGRKIPPKHYRALFERIAGAGGVGVFCGHNIGVSGPKGQLFCTLDDLAMFLTDAVSHGLGFKTVRELAPPPQRVSAEPHLETMARD